MPTNFLNSGVCVAGFTVGTVNVPSVVRPGFVAVVFVVGFKYSVCVFVAFFALFEIVLLLLLLLLLLFLLDFCCLAFGLVAFVVVVAVV